jgi:ATP-binding protein involved in chromosome partitioning
MCPVSFRTFPEFPGEILPNTSIRSVTLSTESDQAKFLNSIEISFVGRTLGEIARVRTGEDATGGPQVVVELDFPCRSAHQALREQIAEALRDEFGVENAQIDLTLKVRRHAVQGNLKRLPGVKNVIAVASGKGGVGKSTVAANLALALAAEGASVGVLDADIYGPSQTRMLGLTGKAPETEDGKNMLPLRAYGLQVMSMGALIAEDQPMVWRGPMVTSALSQLATQTSWEDLDYLIVDMPPGTGDIQLTLAQQIPVSGSIVVTTPQDIATLDARKGLAMFRQVNIPVFGVIENMSTHVCSNCGHEEAIFGEGGAERIVHDFDVALLGRLPLDARIREHMDLGNPTVAAEPDSPIALAYREAAWKIGAEQASQKVDHGAKFGPIVVEPKK